MRAASPPPHVLAAFGAEDEPLPLGGGRGTAWRFGELVLKPLDLAVDELAWQADILSSIPSGGFRVAPPHAARDGRLVVDGWCAWPRLAGEHRPGCWAEIIAVGETFHSAIAHLERPSFLDRRDDPWALGDRVAWGELPLTRFSEVKHLQRLAALLQPVNAPSQVIHGDLTGNVLFADRLPPAIIDLSTYWRPAGFASAIVVVDALCWEGADERLLDAVEHVDQIEQLLLRGLIYRAVTDRLSRAGEPVRPDSNDPYLAPVELVCGLAG